MYCKNVFCKQINVQDLGILCKEMIGGKGLKSGKRLENVDSISLLAKQNHINEVIQNNEGKLRVTISKLNYLILYFERKVL